jgi:hypothetical protein
LRGDAAEDREGVLTRLNSQGTKLLDEQRAMLGGERDFVGIGELAGVVLEGLGQ